MLLRSPATKSLPTLLDPMGKLMSFAIVRARFKLTHLLEICTLCNRIFAKVTDVLLPFSLYPSLPRSFSCSFVFSFSLRVFSFGLSFFLFSHLSFPLLYLSLSVSCPIVLFLLAFLMFEPFKKWDSSLVTINNRIFLFLNFVLFTCTCVPLFVFTPT